MRADAFDFILIGLLCVRAGVFVCVFVCAECLRLTSTEWVFVKNECITSTLSVKRKLLNFISRPLQFNHNKNHKGSSAWNFLTIRFCYLFFISFLFSSSFVFDCISFHFVHIEMYLMRCCCWTIFFMSTFIQVLMFSLSLSSARILRLSVRSNSRSFFSRLLFFCFFLWKRSEKTTYILCLCVLFFLFIPLFISLSLVLACFHSCLVSLS